MEHDYIAHSANSQGLKQTILEHSKGVGKLMREFALSESFRDLYEYCGLIHDIGKYSSAFQKYISGNFDNKVKHSILAAIYAEQNKMREIALPVHGHHSGLQDCSKMLQDMRAMQNEDLDSINLVFATWKGDAGIIKIPDDRQFMQIPNVLMKELFVRMLFSSLVDADSLDTERHFYQTKYLARESLSFDVDFLKKKLQERFIALASDDKKKKLKINELRNSVRLFAESKANLPLGCFSLTLPTGLGKTLCSINWALSHAQFHQNIKRIIVVLPFISIIDQTAEELKHIFNDSDKDYVLEHHSNVTYIENEADEVFNTRQLATENWDYPIIVTTSVQFFESLFSNKRSACRKLHNLQDSIIIFDEIQTLPFNVTEPTLVMLNNLQQLCRCSILFCTATQPNFETRKGFSGISHIESLVDNPEYIFEETRRVTYHPIENYNEVSISDLAEIVLSNVKSSLVVFNTKKKAKLFFDSLKKCFKGRLFHLSTNMCPAHRKRVINDIKESLHGNERVVVSSTQLIEAGVDLDFPTVYRELAPLESIIQSAGRCNREGKAENGDVYLFALKELGQPNNRYRSWTEFANLLYRGNEDRLYTHDFYSSYYNLLVENFGNTDELNITEDRKRLLFQTVSEKYKIIDNNTHSVFVYKYNNESQNLYNLLKNKDFLSKQERQKMSQFCVQLYDNFLRVNAMLIHKEKAGFLIWNGAYDNECGLLTE